MVVAPLFFANSIALLRLFDHLSPPCTENNTNISPFSIHGFNIELQVSSQFLSLVHAVCNELFPPRSIALNPFLLPVANLLKSATKCADVLEEPPFPTAKTILYVITSITD